MSRDSERWIEHSRVVRAGGDPRQCLACLDLALDADPSNAVAWFEKAQALHDCGADRFHVTRAELLEWMIRCLEEAVRCEPGYAPALYNLASAYAQLERHEERAQALRQLLDRGLESTLRPAVEEGHVYGQLIHALLRSGRADEANIALDRAQTRGIPHAVLGLPVNLSGETSLPIEGVAFDFTGGALSALMMELDELWNLDLEEEGRAVRFEAAVRYGRTDVEQAHVWSSTLASGESKYESHGGISPQDRIDTRIQFLWGWARRAIEIGETAFAQTMLSKLTELGAPRLALLEALLREASSDPDGAATKFEQAVTDDPTDGEAWFLWAHALVVRGRLDVAHDVCSKGMRSTARSDRSLWLLLAMLEAQLNPSKALGTLQRMEFRFTGKDIALMKAVSLLAVDRRTEAGEIARGLQPVDFFGDSTLVELCSALRRRCEVASD